MAKHQKMSVDGTVITASDGSKFDTWPLINVLPQFSWNIFLQELAEILSPLQPADMSGIRLAVRKLEAASVDIQMLVNSVQAQTMRGSQT